MKKSEKDRQIDFYCKLKQEDREWGRELLLVEGELVRMEERSYNL
jgi:hypothetical protein